MYTRRFIPSTSPVSSGPIVDFDYRGFKGRGRIERRYFSGVLIQSFDATDTRFVPHGHWWAAKLAPLPNRKLPPSAGRIPRLPG